MTHRYYSPTTGRFITRDPIGYEGGLNEYAYTRNNPVMRGDPSGLDPDDDPLSVDEAGHQGYYRSFLGGVHTGAQIGIKACQMYACWNPIGNCISAVTGKDGVTNENLTNGQRLLSAGGAIGGIAELREAEDAVLAIRAARAARIAENALKGSSFERKCADVLGRPLVEYTVEGITNLRLIKTVRPDDIDVVNHIVTEAKNCGYMYYSSQIQAEMQFATSRGYKFRLMYREGMRFSPRLDSELKLAGAILTPVKP